MVDGILLRIGAELDRCGVCRHRYATFGLFALPLGVNDQNEVAVLLLLIVALPICALFVLWLLRNIRIAPF